MCGTHKHIKTYFTILENIQNTLQNSSLRFLGHSNYLGCGSIPYWKILQGHAYTMTNGDSWSCWVVCLLPFIILLFSHPCWWPIIAKNWCQIIIHPTCRKIPTNLESTQTWSTYDTRGPCKPSNPGFPARRLASWSQKTVVEAMEKYQTKTWLVVYLPSWELTYPLSRHFWVDDVPFFTTWDF